MFEGPVSSIGRIFVTVLFAAALPFDLPVTGAEPANSRFAVVVSNSDYIELGTLRNPAADGQLVASALRAAGFNVTYLRNLKDEQFRVALRQVARDSAKSDVTLFYYAGHGAQVDGVNYLLPVDIAQPEQADDIRLASVSADEVLSVIKSPYKILVLDACRDNPILGRALSRGRGASYRRGLATVSPPSEAAGGVFIAYSTQTDAVAMDGDGANSPFAESFAKYVGSRVSIDDMFALVTRDVLRQTNGFQRPFKYASLDTVFCLTGSCPAGEAQGPIASPTARQASLGFPGSTQDQFSRLNAAKSPDGRKQREQELWLQLTAALPKVVIYGSIVTPEGKKVAYGFEPATAVSDGHRAIASVRTAEFKDGSPAFEEAGSADWSVNCDTNQMGRIKTQFNGAIKLYSRAEQKADLVPIAPGSVGDSLERALCTAPLRVTPIWAINQVEWTPIGVGFDAVPSIYYNDPSNGNIHYLFVRYKLPKADEFGVQISYGWLGIDCGAKAYLGNGNYGANKQGTIVVVLGNMGSWAPFGEGSPAANAYVMLCDQP